ncbi:hypothetical protein BOO86_27965 [Mycobacterium sp. CBMA 234]|uniref:DUF1214 domain-containing protein n=1 Tax=Mycolicibacterium sp. CBMA 234 TaxID=1918495 RepID=UPI0012DD0026|nr:DUF1214 domain-containing protein [Mycolicibacterium sp. CBMA 234]MUL68336.1 hypothetical protein [Mycolicibacterium sp. CBMA 234]
MSTVSVKHRELRRAGTAGVITASVASLTLLAAAPAWALDPTLQSSVDSLIAAQQSTAGTASALPYGNAADRAALPQYAQTLAYFQLERMISQQQGFANRFADMLTAPGANPREEAGNWNPDNVYHQAYLDPNGTYVITGKRGDGADLSFVLLKGLTPANPLAPAIGTLTANQLVYNADGTYTITISATPPAGGGNWMQLVPGVNAVNIRDTQGNWAGSPDTITIQRTDQPSTPSIIPPRLTSSDIAAMLNNIAGSSASSGIQGESTAYQGATGFIMKNTHNSFIPTIPTPGSGALSTQLTSAGSFDLQPGQALVVAVPAITSDYRGVQLATAWGQTLPYATKQTSLNDTQSVSEANGMTYYVVSATDPGVPNWLDSSGYTDGQVLLRWQNYSGSLANVSAQVVDVSQVRNYLPSDTAVVTPQLRVQQLQYRAQSVQNQLSQTKDASWVTLNLAMDDVKAQLGQAQFDALFGTSQVPSLQSRLGVPAVQQSLVAAMAILQNPAGSIASLMRVLPQAVNEVNLPAVLAVARAVRVVQDVIQGITTALQTGQPLHILNAVTAGIGNLGTVAAQTVFDPQTSITAGLLNARDVFTFALTPAPPLYSSTPARAQQPTAAQPTVTNAVAAVASADQKPVAASSIGAGTPPAAAIGAATAPSAPQTAPATNAQPQTADIEQADSTKAATDPEATKAKPVSAGPVPTATLNTDSATNAGSQPVAAKAPVAWQAAESGTAAATSSHNAPYSTSATAKTTKSQSKSGSTAVTGDAAPSDSTGAQNGARAGKTDKSNAGAASKPDSKSASK